MINIRPSDNNNSSEIQNPKNRDAFEKLMDKITLLSLAMDLKRIVMSIHRGSKENSKRFTQEAKRWLPNPQDSIDDDYLQNLLTKVNIVLKEEDSLKKAEDCLMYSVLLQNQALFNSRY